jgi:DNA polymerase III subunit gamma/tau
MSYLVLARKYRPSTFAEVVGQDHVTRTLGNAFASGRVHHAFLFCGPRGCGKTTLARIVGKALNCESVDRQRGATPEPCGVCAACTSISNGSSVDYQEMDGASNRGIDAIRELTEAVRYQPAVLRKKVYVIDEVHMLTTEAFNALLKTLEEPPPHVTFVLATTEPHKLPHTILSRCQRYDFKLVPASRLAQHLTSIFANEGLSIEPGAVSLVVRESGGSVRDALSLCDQLISYVGAETMTERHVAEVLGVADRSLTRTLVRALASGDAGATLAAVESAIERGVDEVQIARAIVRYLRDLSVLQVAPGRRGLIDATDEEIAELEAEAAELPRTRVTQMFDRMLRCCDELGKTLQPRLVLDCALIDVATIEPLVPLGDLIDRLNELESRLAGRPARAGGGGGAKERRPATAPAAPRPSSTSRSAAPEPSAPTVVRGEEASGSIASSSARSAPPAPVDGAAQSSRASEGAAPGAARASDGAAPALPARGGDGAAPVSARGGDGAASGAARASDGAAPALPARGSDGAAPGSARGGDGAASVSARGGDGAAPVSARGGDGAAPVSARGSDGAAPVSVRGSDGAAPVVSDRRGAVSTQGSSGRTGPAPASSERPGPVPASSERPGSVSASSERTGPVPVASERTGPVSMQPSGPVPKIATVAAGSGPHDDAGGGRRFAVPANAAEALRMWNAVLDEMEQQQRRALAALYHHARVLTWTADQLELGFPVEAHDMGEMARDSADELRSIVRALDPALKGVKVAVRLLDAGESSASSVRSVLEDTRERTTAERNRREAEAREHPITKHVLQTFGAQIKEIKTDV